MDTRTKQEAQMGKARRLKARSLVVFGVAGLALLLSGDGPVGGAGSPQGIDPLEVLDFYVKPNVLVVLDSSGSMQRGARLAQAKGYAARLIEQAARAGDHVALLAFGGQGAQGVQLLLPPGPARASGVARVRPLAGGGGTPLAAALAQAERLAAQAVRRGLAGACLWLLTDGRTLESPRAPQGAQLVLVDFDDRLRPAGRCPAWARDWRADYRLPG